MILLLPNAFLSIVAHEDDPELVLVRSRFDGDIERAFALCGACDQCPPVHRLPDVDYRYRSAISSKCLAQIIFAAATAIDFDAFRRDAGDPGNTGDRATGWEHATLLDVWRQLHRDEPGARR